MTRAVLALRVGACLLVFGFAWLLASHAASDGLCCADDAAISLAARSLAQGEGYALPLNFIGESGRFVMDSGISTGPTLVLPGALAIALAGPTSWAPSAASAVLALGLLLLLAWRVGKDGEGGDGAAWLLFALPAMFAFTAGEFFVHWYALLGEAAAWLLLALAAWLAATPGGGTRRALVAGLVAGLAIDAKLLALLGAGAIGGVYAWRVLRRDATAWREGAVYAAAVALPPLLLELVRVALLGLAGYRLWLVQMKAFLGQQGAAPDASALAYVQALGHAMGFAWIALLVPLLVLLALRFRERGREHAAVAALLALAGFATYAAWWLLRSNGWPRYALIGLCLLAAAAGFAMLALPRRRALAFALAVLACLLPWHRLDRLQQPVEHAQREGLHAGARLQALQRLAAIADAPAQRDSVVAGYWWASLVELEYASRLPRRTVGFNRLESADLAKPGTLLLLNPKWDAMTNYANDPDFIRFLAHCTERVALVPPFELRRCEPGVRRPKAPSP